MKKPNHAMQRTADPRHASCVRTCRASGRGPLVAIVPLRLNAPSTSIRVNPRPFLFLRDDPGGIGWAAGAGRAIKAT